VVNGRHRADLEQELRTSLQCSLATFKIPHRIEFVGAIRRTANGKVLHRAVHPPEKAVTAP
jgi:acyl-CoA synthetase (AMP-forming)/AMP-acid ligase II